MAATLVLPTTWQFSLGGLRTGIGWVNLGAYATGGVALLPSDFGITTPYMVSFGGNPGGYAFEWDYTNKKVKAYTQGISTGATAAGALANGAFAKKQDGTESIIRFSATAINTTYDFLPMVEVPNAVSLSAFVLVVEMKGV